MSAFTPISGVPQSDASPARRGRLKIFLGYAAGVGKTFRMLEEGQQLATQGFDIVIGYFEPHGRQDTMSRAERLETIPRRKIVYRGSAFEEMDTAAILMRRPAICLVDELAHTNVPGSERAKRWEDVLVLLEAGIDVLSTLNVQHIESLNDQVWQISGVRVRETIPDWVIQQADEIVMVDVTPAALLNRLKRGAVYTADKAQRAIEHFFKESTLVALRELALRQTAHELEVRQETAPAPTGGVPAGGPAALSAGERAGEFRDRILILITADPSAAMVIRRSRRVADYLRADCFAVYVTPHSDLSELSGTEREAVERHLNFARNLHIETRVVEGEDLAHALVDFAGRHQITQILLARGRQGAWTRLVGGSLLRRIVRLAKEMRVTIVAERRRPADSPGR